MCTLKGEVAQSCPTLCNPVDYSRPGSSIHGILQARILEWVAISFSRRSSQHRDWTQVSHIVGRCFTIWATREVIWNLKRWHWWIYFQGSNGESDIENRLMYMAGGEEGEGDMYGESNIEIYNTIYKIDSQWEFAVWLRELKQGLCDRLKGGMWGRWEGGFGGRGHGCTYGWFLLMYDRKPQNSVKQLFFN